MGRWSAIALSSVDENSIKFALEKQKIDSSSTCHVSATSSHARAMRGVGTLSVAIANMIDLIVIPGLKDGPRVTTSDFPSGLEFKTATSENLAVVEKSYRLALKSWQNKLLGRRTSMSLNVSSEIRRYLRKPEIDNLTAKVLLDSKREFIKVIQNLISAGVFPHDVAADDKIGQVAASAWAKIEATVPSITAPRDDLWIDPESLAAQSTPEAKDLLKRINSALAHIFALDGDEITLVYHGFYFYTPPQWALFQLLRKLPNVNQIFIVHDDGQNPSFEIWRRFFCESLNMPKAELIDLEDKVSDQARLFRQSLAGIATGHKSLGKKIEIKECKNPAEFVRQLNFDKARFSIEDRKQPLAFASSSADLQRITQRLSRATADGKSDLSQLPIGSFLLAAHDCIKRKANRQLSIELESRPVLDMIASGYLDLDSSRPSESLAAFQRVMPFFSDCKDRTSWIERSIVLHRLVLSEVDPRGKRVKNDPDLDAMKKAASNPLRRVSWLDISSQEAILIKETLKSICDLVSGIATGEEVKLQDYMGFLSRHLERALKELSLEHQAEVVEKFNSFKFKKDDKAFVDDLVEIVRLLVSRENDFNLREGDDSDLDSPVVELRALDSLGFKRLSRDLHVANLADGVFPTKVRAVGWPFNAESISGEIGAGVEILSARSQNSSLSDLYLFWLALDGVSDGNLVTLSWISDTGREEQNLSPIVSILSEPDHFSQAVISRVGGLKISAVTSAAQLPPTRYCPKPNLPTIDDDTVTQAISLIDHRAVSSSLICARRFAIQWALGNTASFTAPHHHAMLFGNTIGAISRISRITFDSAVGICTDVWRFMTIGERASSQRNARIRATGPTADPTWNLTIRGSKPPKDDLVSLAYQFAKTARVQDRPALDVGEVAPLTSNFLPPRNTNADDVDICIICPVRSRCNASESPD